MKKQIEKKKLEMKNKGNTKSHIVASIERKMIP